VTAAIEIMTVPYYGDVDGMEIVSGLTDFLLKTGVDGEMDYTPIRTACSEWRRSARLRIVSAFAYLTSLN